MKWNLMPYIEPDPWQPWFAWYPVQTEDHLVWMEWIERKETTGCAMDSSHTDREYRLPNVSNERPLPAKEDA